MPAARRRFPERQGLRLVLRHAAAFREHQCKVVLRRGDALLRRLAVPVDRLPGIGGDRPAAGFVDLSETVLRPGVATFGQRLQDPDRLFVVAAVIGIEPGRIVLRPGSGLRGYERCQGHEGEQRQTAQVTTPAHGRILSLPD